MSRFVAAKHRLLEHIQRKSENRGPCVVLATLLGLARINTVATTAVHDPPVLDHAAFRENDDLATAQNFRAQKWQQAK